MSNIWHPNAQMASLQFSGLVSLVMALQLLHYLSLSAITAVVPEHPIVQGFIFDYLKLLPPILGTVFLLQYLLSMRKLNTSISWSSTLMIFKDEYTLRIYRIAASRAFVVFYTLAFIFFFLDRFEVYGTLLTTLMTVDMVVGTLLLVTSVTFGAIVLFYLFSEDA